MPTLLLTRHNNVATSHKHVNHSSCGIKASLQQCLMQIYEQVTEQCTKYGQSSKHDLLVRKEVQFAY